MAATYAGPPQPAGRPAAALALRVLDRRTALALRERNRAAGEARAATAIRDDQGHMISSVVTDADHPAGQSATERPTRTRARTEVAKQAAVSERRVQALAAVPQMSRVR